MPEEEHIAVQYLVHNGRKNQLDKSDHVVHALGSPGFPSC